MRVAPRAAGTLPRMALGGVGIEQILSSSRTPAQEYPQDNDEFVVVLARSATLVYTAAAGDEGTPA